MNNLFKSKDINISIKEFEKKFKIKFYNKYQILEEFDKLDIKVKFYDSNCLIDKDTLDQEFELYLWEIKKSSGSARNYWTIGSCYNKKDALKIASTMKLSLDPTDDTLKITLMHNHHHVLRCLDMLILLHNIKHSIKGIERAILFE